MIVTGRTCNWSAARRRASYWASSSVVTVIVTSEERVRSIGEDAEEAGGAGHCRSCVNHVGQAPFVCRQRVNLAAFSCVAQGRHANVTSPLANGAPLGRRGYRRAVTTARELIGRPAIVSAYLTPVLFIGGTIVAGIMTPGYDPVRQTISELAAGDAPARVFTTIIFVATGLSHLVTIAFARGIGIPGRITYLAGALASLAVAAFPLPSVAGTSAVHNTAAIIGFVLLAAWPVLGMRFRPDFPWLVRPLGSILGTVILTAICLSFLVVWLSHSSPYIGVLERMAADAESIWPAVVVTALALRARQLKSKG